jgi:hypothetical protein
MRYADERIPSATGVHKAWTVVRDISISAAAVCVSLIFSSKATPAFKPEYDKLHPALQNTNDLISSAMNFWTMISEACGTFSASDESLP